MAKKKKTNIVKNLNLRGLYELTTTKRAIKKRTGGVRKKEKHLKDQANAKNMKAISAEILKYDLEGYDNFKKIVGLLSYFDYQDDDFKNGLMKWAENELEERKAKKVARTFKKPQK
jgi:hypothetical protein